jgi:hypothetical protein
MPSQTQEHSETYPQVAEDTTVNRFVAELQQNGVVVLSPLFRETQIKEMRRAFEAQLRGMRWNDLDGYEREPLRHVLQDVLTLEQGFLDLAVHPLVAKILQSYIGKGFALTEAKGWKSLPTKRDFQGWHGDYWYDENSVGGIAKEVKLAMYLTDVKSGAFNYIRGSHQKQQPRVVQNSEVEDIPKSRILEIKGNAGTCFLFDSSGIHKQAIPILEPRYAVFYNYHDPNVPLSKEAIDYYRYHPLTLNAAFLGNLSVESQRILGFGNKTRYVPSFQRTTEHKRFYKTINSMFGACLWASDFRERAEDRINRILQRKG